MNLTANTGQAKRFTRVFTRRTWIILQSPAANIAVVGKTPDEATFKTAAETPLAKLGGLQLTKTIAGDLQVYRTWWKGELWYGSNVDNTDFQIIIPDEF